MLSLTKKPKLNILVMNSISIDFPMPKHIVINKKIKPFNKIITVSADKYQFVVFFLHLKQLENLKLKIF